MKKSLILLALLVVSTAVAACATSTPAATSAPQSTEAAPQATTEAPATQAATEAPTEAPKGTPLPTVITVYQDKSFTFVTKTPPASFFLKEAARIQKGSGTTGKGDTVGSVTRTQLREIAEKKMKDLNANDVEAAARIIEGSARSMGLSVVEV